MKESSTISSEYLGSGTNKWFYRIKRGKKCEASSSPRDAVRALTVAVHWNDCHISGIGTQIFNVQISYFSRVSGALKNIKV